MAEIFISYARVDRQRAQALASALGRGGWSVWWDRDIPPGRTFDDVIEEALEAAKCVIVLWSRDSVRSEWVKAEASEAARRHILVPVLGDQVMPPLEFRRIQSASLFEWASLESNPDWSHLCQAVGALVGHPPPASTKADAPAGPPVSIRTVPPAGPRPVWRTATAFVVVALVMAGLGWLVASRRSGPATATPLAVAPPLPSAVNASPSTPPDAEVAAPQPPVSSRVGRRESPAPAPSKASFTAAPDHVSSQGANTAPAHGDGPAIRVVPNAAVLSAGASPVSTAAPEPITQSPPRASSSASGAASFDVIYTRGVFRESGQLTVSPDGVRYAESGGRSAFDATCGDLGRVQVMTVIVDGEQRMVELRTKDRVHRFTTDSTAARNGLVSALSRACGAR